jgi:hypothetical protein
MNILVFLKLKLTTMKKHLLLMVICCFGILVKVQCQQYALDKGASFITGNISLKSQGGELYTGSSSDRLQTWTLTPSYNKFVSKNFFIGAGIDMTYMSQGSSSARILGIGPQLGFASGNETSTSYPYFILGAKYMDMKISDNIKPTGSDIFIGFGIIMPLKEHLGISFEGTYHAVSLSFEGVSQSGNTLSIGVGIVGLLY